VTDVEYRGCAVKRASETLNAAYLLVMCGGSSEPPGAQRRAFLGLNIAEPSISQRSARFAGRRL